MRGLDIAAGYRPRVPANKKRRTIQGMEEATPFSDAGLDTATDDFRQARSARDLLMGNNVGRRPGGEYVHPMMPGAAGMGTGPSNTDYGGLGDRAKFFIDQENDVPEMNDPQQAQNQLLQRYFGMETPNTGATRQQARSGLSLEAMREISPNFAPQGPDRPALSPTQAAVGALNRDAYAGRVQQRQGNVVANAMQQRADRQQRMAGPSMDDRLAMMAAGGNQDAQRTLALSNQRFGDRAGMATAANANAGLLEQRMADAGLSQAKSNALTDPSFRAQSAGADWLAGGGETVGGPLEDYLGGLGLGSGGRQAARPPSWVIDKDGQAMDEQEFRPQAPLRGVPADQIEAIAAMLPKKRTWGQFLAPVNPWLQGQQAGIAEEKLGPLERATKGAVYRGGLDLLRRRFREMADL